MAYNPIYFVFAVQALCPGLQPGLDFVAVDNGDGPFISEWRRPDVTQPTPEQIAAVDTDAVLQTFGTVLPQDLMAQFTTDDIATIQAAISGNSSYALLWYAMLAQRDAMGVTNPRFKAGWQTLTTILGAARMAAVAAALGVTVN